MNFEEAMNTWNEQKSPAFATNEAQLSEQIRQQIQTGTKAERRVATAAGFVSTLALIWVGFWVYQLATVGAVALREKDMMPPLGAALISPAWVGTLAAVILANFFVQKSNRQRFSHSLLGYISEARSQTVHRIFLWRAIPLALASCVLIGGVSVVFSSEFAFLFGSSPLLSLALLVPDLCILTFIILRGRHLIRTVHQPRLHEIDSLLAGFKTAEPEVQ